MTDYVENFFRGYKHPQTFDYFLLIDNNLFSDNNHLLGDDVVALKAKHFELSRDDLSDLVVDDSIIPNNKNKFLSYVIDDFFINNNYLSNPSEIDFNVIPVLDSKNYLKDVISYLNNKNSHIALPIYGFFDRSGQLVFNFFINPNHSSKKHNYGRFQEISLKPLIPYSLAIKLSSSSR